MNTEEVECGSLVYGLMMKCRQEHACPDVADSIVFVFASSEQMDHVSSDMFGL